jgi:hypothetical protein
MGKSSPSVSIPFANSLSRFGAVLEEFEVRDALESVLHVKQEPDPMIV